MMYISLEDNLYEKNIEQALKTMHISKISKNSYKELKKAKIVICDSNIEKVNAYVAMNKIILIYDKGQKINFSNVLDKNVYFFKNTKELKEILTELKQEKKQKIGNKLRNIVVGIMFLILIGILIFCTYENKKCEDKIIIKKVPKQVEKVDLKKENFVFLGDSITYFYNLDKFYPDLPVINSGKGGYQTEDILENLADFVYKYNPSKVFLLIGTNDIAFTDYSDEEIASKISEIVDKIKENRSKAKIYVESIYPVNRNVNNDVVDISMVKNRNNTRIKNINNILKKMCKEKKITYIDIYSVLANEDGDLNLEYTRDGLHTNDKGYEVITKKIMEYIEIPNKIEKE